MHCTFVFKQLVKTKQPAQVSSFLSPFSCLLSLFTIVSLFLPSSLLPPLPPQKIWPQQWCWGPCPRRWPQHRLGAKVVATEQYYRKKRVQDALQIWSHVTTQWINLDCGINLSKLWHSCNFILISFLILLSNFCCCCFHLPVVYLPFLTSVVFELMFYN